MSEEAILAIDDIVRGVSTTDGALVVLTLQAGLNYIDIALTASKAAELIAIVTRALDQAAQNRML
jgi:hypothetical protein